MLGLIYMHLRRLIKKSEYYDSYLYNPTHYDFEKRDAHIYKNPSKREINEIRNDDCNNSVRGIISETGDIFAWISEVLHYEMKNAKNISNGIHFVFDSRDSIDIFIEDMQMNSVYEIFNKAKFNLANMGIDESVKMNVHGQYY